MELRHGPRAVVSGLHVRPNFVATAMALHNIVWEPVCCLMSMCGIRITAFV